MVVTYNKCIYVMVTYNKCIYLWFVQVRFAFKRCHAHEMTQYMYLSKVSNINSFGKCCQIFGNFPCSTHFIECLQCKASTCANQCYDTVLLGYCDNGYCDKLLTVTVFCSPQRSKIAILYYSINRLYRYRIKREIGYNPVWSVCMCVCGNCLEHYITDFFQSCCPRYNRFILYCKIIDYCDIRFCGLNIATKPRWTVSVPTKTKGSTQFE